MQRHECRTYSGLLRGWQEPIYLRKYLAFPTVYIDSKLKLKAKPMFEPCQNDMGWVALGSKQHVNSCAKQLPFSSFLLKFYTGKD